MASSLISSISAPLYADDARNRDLSPSIGPHKSSFLNSRTGLLPFNLFSSRNRTTSTARRWSNSICAKGSYDHIPKQFREENLKDGCEWKSHFSPRSSYICFIFCSHGVVSVLISCWFLYMATIVVVSYQFMSLCFLTGAPNWYYLWMLVFSSNDIREYW